MKPISLSISESIPTPHAVEGSPVRLRADRQVADAHEKNDQSHAQSLPKAKPVSRKRFDKDELPAPKNEKEKSPVDRMTFGEFLQAPQPREEVAHVPASPNVSSNVEFDVPQSIVLTQSKRPVLQNVLANVPAQPEQTISPVHLPGLPNSFAMEIEPQLQPQPISSTTTEAFSKEIKLLPVTEINPQFSETPSLTESAKSIANKSALTPQPASKQVVAEISLTPNPIKHGQLPAASLEVNQELPTEISKPVTDNMTIDLGLPEAVEPMSRQQVKPVSPVDFDVPTQPMAFTYRPELMSVKTDEPEFIVAPSDVEGQTARISSILKKLIQEHPTELLLPAVSYEMPIVESSLTTNTPFTVNSKVPQGTQAFDSNPIHLNSRVDSELASQVVAQISDQWSMDDIKIGQNSTREITIQIKPQELGAIKILVETSDGRLQARIEASELITSEMLIKEKGQLLSALKDRGLDLPDLDISYRDPESRNSHRQDQQEPGQRFDFRNEQKSYKNQARFNLEEPEAVKPLSTKRFVVNVIA
ncbi:MAG: flagellar hook-length control protein FliK [Pirellulaceae bacterium]